MSRTCDDNCRMAVCCIVLEPKMTVSRFKIKYQNTTLLMLTNLRNRKYQTVISNKEKSNIISFQTEITKEVSIHVSVTNISLQNSI